MQTNTALCSKQSNPSPTDCQGQSDTILLDYARKGGSFGDTQFTTIGSIADNLARQQLLTQLRDIFRQQKRLTQFNQTFDQWIRQQNQHITHIADSNTTAFTDGPLVLRCGDWTANDSGVYRQQLQKDGTLASANGLHPSHFAHQTADQQTNRRGKAAAGLLPRYCLAHHHSALHSLL